MGHKHFNGLRLTSPSKTPILTGPNLPRRILVKVGFRVQGLVSTGHRPETYRTLPNPTSGGKVEFGLTHMAESPMVLPQEGASYHLKDKFLKMRQGFLFKQTH